MITQIQIFLSPVIKQLLKYSMAKIKLTDGHLKHKCSVDASYLHFELVHFSIIGITVELYFFFFFQKILFIKCTQ